MTTTKHPVFEGDVDYVHLEAGACSKRSAIVRVTSDGSVYRGELNDFGGTNWLRLSGVGEPASWGLCPLYKAAIAAALTMLLEPLP
jgi:hypothetical protein